MEEPEEARATFAVEEGSRDIAVGGQVSQKKLYALPRLVVYGSLIKLTRGSRFSQADGMGGFNKS
jgi:hypothetical protein